MTRYFDVVLCASWRQILATPLTGVLCGILGLCGTVVLFYVRGCGVAGNFRQGVRQSVAFLRLSLIRKNIGKSARFYA